MSELRGSGPRANACGDSAAMGSGGASADSVADVTVGAGLLSRSGGILHDTEFFENRIAGQSGRSHRCLAQWK